MSSRSLAASLGLRSAKVTDLAARFGHWWMTEFLNFFPSRVAEWLAGQNQKVLIVAAEQTSVSIQLLSNTRRELALSRISKAEYSAASINEFLRLHGLGRNDVCLGLQLPSERFFSRSILLPFEAARSLDAVVLEDLKRKTPFRPEEVYHGYRSARLANENKLLVHQWVIRRDFVKDAVASFRFDLEHVAVIEGASQPAENAPRPIIALRQDLDKASTWIRKGLLALLLATIAMAIVTAAVKYWHQQMLIEELTSDLVVARAKAQKIRSHLDKVEQQQGVLRRLRTDRAETPRLLDVWEEITRILPAHSWLAELRLSEIPQRGEQQVVMIGFSAAASSLVGLVARSPMFSDAVLTAPISMDPVEGRERFVVQAKVRRLSQGRAP